MHRCTWHMVRLAVVVAVGMVASGLPQLTAAQYDGSSSSGSSSSTGGVPPFPHLGVPTHSLFSYIFDLILFQVIILLVLLILFYFLPLSLLLKLGVSLYGLQPVTTMYQTRRKEKADIQMRGIDLETVAAVASKAVPATPAPPPAPSESPPSRRDAPSDATLRTRLLAGSEDDSSHHDASEHVAVPIHPNDEHAKVSSPTPPVTHHRKRPGNRKMNIFLHTETNSLWVMGRIVKFDQKAIDAEEAAIDAEHNREKPAPWTACIDYLMMCRYMYRGCRCCRPHTMGRTARIKRLLKIILFLSLYTSIVLLVGLALLDSAYFVLSNDHGADGVEYFSECPGLVQKDLSWDCWAYRDWHWTSSPAFIDCSVEGASVDARATPYLICFRWHDVKAETYLSSLSTIASLFTLVLGGAATLFAWLLTHLKTRAHVQLMYLGPCSFFLLWCLAAVLGRLSSALAMTTPVVLCAISVALIQIRLVVGFEHEAGNLIEDVTHDLHRTRIHARVRYADGSDSDSSDSEEDANVPRKTSAAPPITSAMHLQPSALTMRTVR